MVPLEVIGLLGLLCIFFIIGTVKALRAKAVGRRKPKLRSRPKAAARETAPTPVKPTGQSRAADA